MISHGRALEGGRRPREPQKAAGTSESRVFAVVWVGILLSSTATFALLISLSANAVRAGETWTYANVIVLTQWAPAVVALPLIKWLSRHVSARRLLASVEVGSAAACACVVVVVGDPVALLALLLAKGLLDNVSKVSRPVVLREHLTGPRLERSAGYYNVAALVGSGAGSLGGALAYGEVGLPVLTATCGAMHVAAVFSYLAVPRRSGSSAPRPRARLETSALPQVVKQAACLYVASVIVFQGYHNVVRTVYPVDVLGLEPSSVGLLQAITSASYIAGAVLAAQQVLVRRRYMSSAALVHVATVGAMCALPFTTAALPGLTLYALFAIVFEVGFALHLRRLVVDSPPDALPVVLANTNAWAMGGMVCVALAGSVLVDVAGLLAVTTILSVLGAAALLLALRIGRDQRPVAPES